MSNKNETIFDRIKRLREGAGMSIPQLAKASGLSPTCIWNWETKGFKPTVKSLSLVAPSLRTTVEYLREGRQSEAVDDIQDLSNRLKTAVAAKNGVQPQSITISWTL